MWHIIRGCTIVIAPVAVLIAVVVASVYIYHEATFNDRYYEIVTGRKNIADEVIALHGTRSGGRIYTELIMIIEDKSDLWDYLNKRHDRIYLREQDFVREKGFGGFPPDWAEIVPLNVPPPAQFSDYLASIGAQDVFAYGHPVIGTNAQDAYIWRCPSRNLISFKRAGVR